MSSTIEDLVENMIVPFPILLIDHTRLLQKICNQNEPMNSCKNAPCPNTGPSSRPEQLKIAEATAHFSKKTINFVSPDVLGSQ